MSKYSLLFTLLFFVIAITYMVDLVVVGSVSAIIGGDVITDPEITLGGLRSFIDTYFKLLTFRVTGFPVPLVFMLSIIFIPINLIIIYYIADIVKDLIPFT